MKYKWFWNFDCDIIFDSESLLKIIKIINKSKTNVMYLFSGINILKDANNHIGFSNFDSAKQAKPFVGCGDFLCYVPIYTKNKKVYKLHKSIFDSKINMFYYDTKFCGLVFLHLSVLDYIQEHVDSYIDSKRIFCNIKRTNDIFLIHYYDQILKSTSQKMIDNLTTLKNKNIDFFKI